MGIVNISFLFVLGLCATSNGQVFDIEIDFNLGPLFSLLFGGGSKSCSGSDIFVDGSCAATYRSNCGYLTQIFPPVIKGCVNGASCSFGSCTCNPFYTNTNVAINGKQYTVCTSPSNYQASCYSKSDCSPGLSCVSRRCACSAGPNTYDKNTVYLQFDSNGLENSYLGACTCASNATLTNQGCTCQGLTTLTSNTCTPYANAVLNGTYYYTCPKDTKANDQTQSCNCTMNQSQYNSSAQACKCPGFANPSQDKTKCVPYFNGFYQNSTQSFVCPNGTAPNTTSSTCNCTMGFAQYNPATGCSCPGYAISSSNNSTCVPYTNGFYNNSKQLFDCPADTKPNANTTACDCIMANATYVPNTGCQCVGAAQPSNDNSTCEPYLYATYNTTTKSFLCPYGTDEIDSSKSCNCTMDLTQYNSTTGCSCPGYATISPDNSTCVPYINGFYNNATQMFACPGDTKPNSNTTTCDCIMANATYVPNVGCQCVGAAQPNKDNSTCVPYLYATYDNTNNSFVCPDGTDKKDSSKSCNCTMTYSTYNDTLSSCVCNGAAEPSGGVCVGLKFATLVGNQYVCPSPLTQANFTADSCTCIKQYSSYNNNTKKCDCLSLTDTIGFQCIPFTNAVFNGTNLICPPETSRNNGNSSCDCTMASAQYQNGQCTCIGASYLNDDDPTTKTKCNSYAQAVLNTTTKIYGCPDGLDQVDAIQQCALPAVGPCVGMSFSYVPYCVGYTKSVYDPATQTFSCTKGQKGKSTVCNN